MIFSERKNYFILADSAEDISSLSAILNLTNRFSGNNTVKILLTVRDYAKNDVLTTVSRIAHYEELSIASLESRDTVEILQNEYNNLSVSSVAKIAALAKGNLQIAICMAQIILRNKSVTLNKMTTNLYQSIYGAELREMLLSDNQLRALGIVALLRSIRLDQGKQIIQLLSTAGFTEESFVEVLQELTRLRVVSLYKNTVAKICDPSFADYLLRFVFFDNKLVDLSTTIEMGFKSYSRNIIQSLQTMMQLFGQEDIKEYVNQAIHKTWVRLKESNEADFYSYMQCFYPINQKDIECARDKPVDHTATYPLGKVLMLDRWGTMTRLSIPVGNDGIFFLPSVWIKYMEVYICYPKSHLSRKTRTARICQYPATVRVCALMRLNRRVPNGTHGGVGGRSLN